MRLPTVAVIGRPNVGKSSLFNRFLKKQLAVVHEQPGITRDRNYAVCDWSGVSFRLVDTGGIVPQTKDLMEKLIFDQTEFAVNESDLVLFVVDSQVGPDPSDRKIAQRLLRAGKNSILVANKVDNDQLEREIFEFLSLGLGDPMPVSATIGRGIGELLDAVVASLPVAEKPTQEEGAIRVAVVGRPNVGKSSFINRLIGEPRLLVTPIPGTTRDAVDTQFEYDEQRYILIDTAGLRRKYKVHENVEFYTTLRTIRAVEGCDVAVVLVDAQEGLRGQDQRILEEVLTNRRAAVLAVNKWDLVEKDSKTADQYTKSINAILAKYAYLPVIYVSALIGQRVTKVMAEVKKVYDESHKRIPTAQLNEFLQKALKKRHPPAKQGKHIKFNYVAQTEVAPPTFVFFTNHPKLVDKSYISYLGNQIRSEFGFAGVPFRMKFRRK
jgi:GTP-binding protein